VNQTFTCDACKTTGAVRIRIHEDVWSVYSKIIRKHREMEPRCMAGIDQIKAHSQLGIIKAARARSERR
jgi:hypothetical protein